jgi:hypothetical protein
MVSSAVVAAAVSIVTVNTDSVYLLWDRVSAQHR